MPNLYVVATPIGNLEDISLRALKVLRSVKLIAAEDTRKTRRLLNAYDIKTPLTSYHEHNKWSKLDYLLKFLEETGDVALVSDAGTPGISDPGHELIAASQSNGIPIVPIPGASVVVAALAVSGLPTERFTFLGFLPRATKARKALLKSVAEDPGTLVVFEAPHRIPDALSDIFQVLGDRRISVCRELTKIYEEIFRGRVSGAIAKFTEPKGEFTMVIEGSDSRTDRLPATESVEKRLGDLRDRGMTAKQAMDILGSETGLARRELYRLWLEISRSKSGITRRGK